MHLRFYLFIFIGLTNHFTYAATEGLYWMPSGNYGTLYEKSGNPISSPFSYAIGSIHYQRSSALGVTASFDKLLDHTPYCQYKGAIVTGLAKYNLNFLMQTLSFKNWRWYGQGGMSYAKIKEEGYLLNVEIFKNIHLVFGVGAQYDLQPRLMLDVSWKRCISLSLLNHDQSSPIMHYHRLTASLGFRLI